jgi:hypothetical protein
MLAPPNLALQRSWIHKLHPPMGWRAAAELRRSRLVVVEPLKGPADVG